MDHGKLFVGPNMYNGLMKYMEEIGEEYLDLVPLSYDDAYPPSLVIICRQCGSVGPFRMNIHSLIEMDTIGKTTKEFLSGFSSVKCRVFSDGNGGLLFRNHISVQVDIDELAAILMEHDLIPNDYIECPRCNDGFGIEFCDQGRVEGDSFEMYGDLHFITDTPTHIEYNDENECIHQETTRDGVIEHCHECYNWDEFSEGYKELENPDILPVPCDEECFEWCPISRSFSLFRITPRELMNTFNQKLANETYDDSQANIVIDEIKKRKSRGLRIEDISPYPILQEANLTQMQFRKILRDIEKGVLDDG